MYTGRPGLHGYAFGSFDAVMKTREVATPNKLSYARGGKHVECMSLWDLSLVH